MNYIMDYKSLKKKWFFQLKLKELGELQQFLDKLY
jgi:hypothetical protein